MFDPPTIAALPLYDAFPFPAHGEVISLPRTRGARKASPNTGTVSPSPRGRLNRTPHALPRRNTYYEDIAFFALPRRNTYYELNTFALFRREGNNSCIATLQILGKNFLCKFPPSEDIASEYRRRDTPRSPFHARAESKRVFLAPSRRPAYCGNRSFLSKASPSSLNR